VVALGQDVLLVVGQLPLLDGQLLGGQLQLGLLDGLVGLEREGNSSGPGGGGLPLPPPLIL